MSLVDYFLNSVIKRLQKTQKARNKKRKAKKRASARKSRKPAKPKSPKKKTAKRSTGAKRKAASPKKSTVKRPVKKASKKPPGAKKKRTAEAKVKKKKPAARIPKDKTLPEEVCIGEITHFFARIQVVVLKMTAGSISVGDTIRIKGRGMDLLQKVGSLQIESVDVKTACKGQIVGLKVEKDVKVGSKVYKSDK